MPNFTDEKYHNLGVGMDAEKPDLGRFDVTKDEKDKGAFKTPTIRNVALTAPYMHDGSQKTLEEVVEWYAKGGHPNQWLDKSQEARPDRPGQGGPGRVHEGRPAPATCRRSSRAGCRKAEQPLKSRSSRSRR